MESLSSLTPIVIPLLIVSLGSLIQSIAGIGILALGTPLLALLGTPFNEIIWTLWPSALAISMAQNWGQSSSIPKKFVLLAVFPGLLIGIILIENGFSFFLSKVLMTLALAVAVLQRIFSTRQKPRSLSKSQWLTAMFFTSVLQGLSNLGGPILTLLASRFSRKTETRAFIAFHYMIFGWVQLGTLLAMGKEPPKGGLIHLTLLPGLALGV